MSEDSNSFSLKEEYSKLLLIQIHFLNYLYIITLNLLLKYVILCI